MNLTEEGLLAAGYTDIQRESLWVGMWIITFYRDGVQYRLSTYDLKTCTISVRRHRVLYPLSPLRVMDYTPIGMWRARLK